MQRSGDDDSDNVIFRVELEVWENNNLDPRAIL